MRTVSENTYRTARLEVEEAFAEFKKVRAQHNALGPSEEPPHALLQAKARLDAAYEALDRLDFFHVPHDMKPQLVPASSFLAA